MYSTGYEHINYHHIKGIHQSNGELGFVYKKNGKKTTNGHILYNVIEQTDKLTLWRVT